MIKHICPHCKNPIYDDEALLCLYCGESLNRRIGVMGRIRYSAPKVIVVIIVISVLLSFLLLVLR